MTPRPEKGMQGAMGRKLARSWPGGGPWGEHATLPTIRSWAPRASLRLTEEIRGARCLAGPLNMTAGLLLVVLTYLDTQISLREGWEGSGGAAVTLSLHPN